MWKKIKETDLKTICHINGEVLTSLDLKKINLLKDFINKNNLIDFKYIDRACPLISALRDGNHRRNYHNPKNSINFFKEYGIRNPEKILNDILDHGIAFRNNSGKVFYVGNPYLETLEIEKVLDSYIKKTCLCEGGLTVDTLYGKYYENLNYEVLGKNNSFYNPNNTNSVVLFYNE